MQNHSIKKITIIGVGLIGGSFGQGIKKRLPNIHIMGFGSSKTKLSRAVELNIIDEFSLDIATAIEHADLIFIAVPMGAFETIFSKIKPYLKPGAIITDAGSSKESVIQAAKTVFGQEFSQFIPSHPIAGKEKSGVEAADGDLYINHKVIITPTKFNSVTDISLVKNLWQTLGAEVIEMEASYHDEVLAATSHLPHLLAFGLVDLLTDNKNLGDVFQYTAGGFRDFTRIASSDPTMWRDIATYNSESLAKWLKSYQIELNKMITMVENKQGEELYSLFERARDSRNQLIKESDDNGK